MYFKHQAAAYYVGKDQCIGRLELREKKVVFVCKIVQEKVKIGAVQWLCDLEAMKATFESA
jgi:hypothetical protein